MCFIDFNRLGMFDEDYVILEQFMEKFSLKALVVCFGELNMIQCQ